jgi:hypothetical protein
MGFYEFIKFHKVQKMYPMAQMHSGSGPTIMKNDMVVYRGDNADWPGVIVFNST